jgi:hypothetical protein
MARFLYRYGRRIPLPSTIEIKHAYKLHSVLEAHRLGWAAEEGMPSNASWDEIIDYKSHRLAAQKTRDGAGDRSQSPAALGAPTKTLH